MDLVLLKTGIDLPGASQVGGDIAGDVASGLEGCIEIVSSHFGMKQQITTDVSNTARTSGRPVINDVTCVKYFDKASAKLYQHCLEAKPLDNGGDDETAWTRLFLCRNSNGEIANLMTISMQNTIISSIECQSHPNDMPTEQFLLNFTAISWQYTEQGSDLSVGGTLYTKWSVANNRLMSAG